MTDTAAPASPAPAVRVIGDTADQGRRCAVCSAQLDARKKECCSGKCRAALSKRRLEREAVRRHYRAIGLKAAETRRRRRLEAKA